MPDETFRPQRGDAVEAFIREYRNTLAGHAESHSAWVAIDQLLDDYREHADTGVPLDEEIHGPHHESTDAELFGRFDPGIPAAIQVPAAVEDQVPITRADLRRVLNAMAANCDPFAMSTYVMGLREIDQIEGGS